jgi:hypothetical protein
MNAKVQYPDPRRVVVAGATGFVGRAVMARLAERGWQVIVVSTDPGKARRSFPEAEDWIGYDGEALERAVAGCGKVIRLSGQNPLQQRWTAAYKRSMWESRVGTSARFAAALAASTLPGRVIVTAGGINVFAPGGEAVVRESSPPGGNWVAKMLQAAQAALAPAGAAGARVVTICIGLALGRGDGPLAFMERPFRLRLGGHLGDGRQYVPWIHLDDLAAMFVAALEQDGWSGNYIAASPNPMRAAEVASAIGAGLGRASWLHMPAGLARLMLGEVATLVLSSYRAMPERALAQGFRFAWPDLAPALADIHAGDDRAAAGARGQKGAGRISA